jgi:preprotein translocase subunit SecD
VSPARRLLFIAGGKVLMAPVILGPIDASETVVSGRFSEDEVKHIALALART